MKPELRTACWVILTLEVNCSAGFRADLQGSFPGPHTSGLPRAYAVKIAQLFTKTTDSTNC